MAGMLPDSVRWKLGRDHVGWRFIDECFGTPPPLEQNQELAKLCRLAGNAANSTANALQCSTQGVVSETDLVYLNFWITRFKDFRD